jgi:hypothetical protein
MPALDVIDRIAPTLEPDKPVVMHQNWHHLLFLHWEIRPEELQRLVRSRTFTRSTFEPMCTTGDGTRESGFSASMLPAPSP